MTGYLRVLYSLFLPFVDGRKFLRAILPYGAYWGDLIKYRRLSTSEAIDWKDLFPMVHDKTPAQTFGGHYFYQDIWAFRKIYNNKPRYHIDVGSRVDFVGFLTVITRLVCVDIRTLKTCLDNLYVLMGSILSLPFKDNSIHSLSCLHVAEHIGLGRYGDELNPRGTELACKELARVLAKGGHLYFSVPMGRPRVCYNAHRIHSSQQIMEYFDDLELVEFAGIDDSSCFYPIAELRQFNECQYGCGLFLFTKT